MLKRLLCLIRIHGWCMERIENVPGSDFDDGPIGYEAGGVNWHIRCGRCGKRKMVEKRNVWVTENLPPYPFGNEPFI